MKKLLLTKLGVVLSVMLLAQTDVLPPVLNSPANAAVNQMPDVVLNWYPVAGIGPVTYEVQYDLDDTFPDPVTNTVNFSSFKTSELFFGITYYWRVRAMDNTGISDWSEKFSFTIFKRISPNLPADLKINANPNEEIKWITTGLSGITHIDIQLDTSYYWKKSIATADWKQLNDVFLRGDDEYWVVGDSAGHSYAGYFNGTEWQRQEIPIIGSLQSIDAFETSSPWISGDNGQLAVYSNSGWKSRNFNDIHMLSGTNGWIVGNEGTILALANGSWEEPSSPTMKNLNSISMFNDSFGFIVGDTGTILEYDGAEWNLITSFSINKNLKSVFMVNSSLGWAVGDSGVILKYNGINWISETSPTYNNLRSIHLVNDTLGWVVGEGGIILKYDGDLWLIDESTPTQINLTSVYMVNSSIGYATGDMGVIIKFDGVNWVLDQSLQTTINFSSVYFLNELTGWIIGNSDTAFYHANNTWTEIILPDVYDIKSISSPDNVNLYAVGANGAVISSLDTNWQELSFNSNEKINAVFFPSADIGWAVGDEGTILRKNGPVWERIETSINDHLNSIFFSDAVEGWVVGGSGTILKYDFNTQNYIEVYSPTVQDLNCVYFTDNMNGWACGAKGVILKYSDNEWVKIDSIGSDLNFITVTSQDEVWAGGVNGILYLYDGVDWTLMTSGTNNTLYSSSHPTNLSEKTLFVGSKGTIIESNDPFSSPVSVIKSVSASEIGISLSNLYFGKDYYWRVRARHNSDTSAWSSVRTFLTKSIVINESPSNNAINQMINVELKWTAIPGVIGYIYEYSPDSMFSNPLVGQVNTSSIILSHLSFGEEYYWRVKAYHVLDTTFWSNTWRFQTINVVGLVSPANGSYVDDLFPTVSWQAVTGTEGFEIMYDVSDAFDDPEIVYEEGNKFFHKIITILTLNETYYWKVRAFNDGDTTLWSPTWSFTVGVQSVHNLLTDNSISIYPNPARESLTLKLNTGNFSTIEVRISNLLGQVVFSEQLTFNHQDAIEVINLDKMDSGLYIIQIRTGESVLSRKIIIDK